MAISLIGFGTTSYTGTSTSTFNFSSLVDISGAGSVTLQQNDQVVCYLVHSGTAGRTNAQLAPTTAGYSGNPIAASAVTSSDTDFISLNGFFKFMGASPDSSVVLPGCAAATNSMSVVIFVYRGVDTATPLAGVTPTTVTAINGTKPDPPLITTPASPPGCVVVGILGQAQATGAALTPPTTTAYDATANYVKASNNTATTNDSAILVGHKTGVAVNTAFNASAANGGTTANTDSSGAISFVLQPAPTVTSGALSGSGTGALSATGGMITPSAVAASAANTFPGVGSSSTVASGAMSAAATGSISLADNILATGALAAAGAAAQVIVGQSTAGASLSGSGAAVSIPGGQTIAQSSISGAGAGATGAAGAAIAQSASAMAASGTTAATGRAIATSAVNPASSAALSLAGEATAAGATSMSSSASSVLTGAVMAPSALSGSASGANVAAGTATVASSLSGASTGDVAPQGAVIAAAALSASGAAVANDNGTSVSSGVMSANGSSSMAGDATAGDVVSSGVLGCSASGSLAESGSACATGASASSSSCLIGCDPCSIATTAFGGSAGARTYFRNPVAYAVDPKRCIANDRDPRSVEGCARPSRCLAPALQRRRSPQ